MYLIALACDGCGESLAWVQARHRGRLRALADRSELPARVGGLLKAHAETQGWERATSAESEEWFCPTCRRARDGEALTAAAAAS